MTTARAENTAIQSDHAAIFSGTQIAYFCLVWGAACLSALLGYQIADRGFDALDRGERVRGAWQFWFGIFICCRLTLLLIWGGLHLSFILWFRWLL